jgi:hypothetical protein
MLFKNSYRYKLYLVGISIKMSKKIKTVLTQITEHPFLLILNIQYEGVNLIVYHFYTVRAR